MDALRDGNPRHAPPALLFTAANTILAQGAALADMALCDRLEPDDETTLIETGKYAAVNVD